MFFFNIYIKIFDGASFYSRYSPKDLPARPQCNHATKAFKCSSLTMTDIKYFHESFYKFKDKIKQDAFLLKYCILKQIKRRRPKNKQHKEKQFQTKFTIFSKTKKSTVPVCQKAFLDILHITKHRVQYVIKQYDETGTIAVEKRGGDHKSHLYKEKKQAIITFVNLFHVDEAHYCRGQSQRHYLPAELSINEINKMYNEQADVNLKVKKGYFRRVFNTNYSLGFGSPRTDVCSACLQFSEKLKTEKDIAERNNLIIAKRVHSLKAKAFYGLVKEERIGLKTFSFDCQKNLPLPKVPDQSTYYSRQVYLYNLTIVEGSSKSKLTRENVYAYCWTEDEFAKGANEIASALYNRLKNTDFSDIDTVRLIADGCAGQNKNSIVLAMCCTWFINNAPENIQAVELVFPVVGHSFIPPDRVFAQTEKEARKREVLVEPDDYIKIIEKRSTVVRMGSDCPIFDWKKAMSSVIKDVGTWHFQFKQCKRYFIKRSKSNDNVLLKGDINYRVSEGVFKKINRKNKNIKMINPIEIVKHTTKINDNKITDVKKLLNTHYGERWGELEKLIFYRKMFSRIQAIPEIGEVNNNILCEHQEDNFLNLRV